MEESNEERSVEMRKGRGKCDNGEGGRRETEGQEAEIRETARGKGGGNHGRMRGRTEAAGIKSQGKAGTREQKIRPAKKEGIKKREERQHETVQGGLPIVA